MAVGFCGARLPQRIVEGGGWRVSWLVGWMDGWMDGCSRDVDDPTPAKTRTASISTGCRGEERGGGGFLIERRREQRVRFTNWPTSGAAVENGEYQEKRITSPADKLAGRKWRQRTNRSKRKRLGSDWAPGPGEGLHNSYSPT